MSRYLSPGLSHGICPVPFILMVAMEPNQPIDPTEGVMPTNEAIDVTPEPITDNTQLIGTESQSSTHSPESPSEKPVYHSLNWRAFLRYAKGQGINTKGKTRAEIELELLSQANK